MTEAVILELIGLAYNLIKDLWAEEESVEAVKERLNLVRKLKGYQEERARQDAAFEKWLEDTANDAP